MKKKKLKRPKPEDYDTMGEYCADLNNYCDGCEDAIAQITDTRPQLSDENIRSEYMKYIRKKLDVGCDPNPGEIWFDAVRWTTGQNIPPAPSLVEALESKIKHLILVWESVKLMNDSHNNKARNTPQVQGELNAINTFLDDLKGLLKDQALTSHRTEEKKGDE